MTPEALFNPARTGLKRVETWPHLVDDIAGRLNRQIVGQEEAVNTVARAIIRGKARVTDSKQPLSISMFLGPTGVGKTEMAKVVARDLHGDEWEKHFKLIDCTVLQERQDTRRIQGSGPEYVGYGDPLLIPPEFVNQKGDAVLVFDEFEKAHQAVQRLLLPILHEGELTVFVPTGKGSSASSVLKEVAPIPLKFNNVHIVITSNIGAEELGKSQLKPIGFRSETVSRPDNRSIVLRELRRVFASMPELLGRIGEENIVVFNHLAPKHYELIFDRAIAKINEKQSGNKTPIEIQPALKEWLIKEAVGDGRYGARDIEHVIEKHVLTKAAEARVSASLKDGSPLVMDLEEDGKTIGLWTKDIDTSPSPNVQVVSSQRALPAPASPDVQKAVAPTVTNEKESVVTAQRGVPFAVDPLLKMKRDPETGKNMERIKIKVNGCAEGSIQIIEEESSIIVASGERLFRLAIEMRSTSPKKKPTCRIIVPAGEYKGIGNTREARGMPHVHVERWKDLRGIISRLVFTKKDFASLKIVVNRTKLLH